MTKRRVTLSRWMAAFLLAGATILAVPPTFTSAQQVPTGGPDFSATGELLLPPDYREWIYLTSGLGMTYGPAAAAEGRRPNFDNVFVNRDAYRQFMTNGKWPDKTIFILEIRDAEDHVRPERPVRDHRYQYLERRRLVGPVTT